MQNTQLVLNHDDGRRHTNVDDDKRSIQWEECDEHWNEQLLFQLGYISTQSIVQHVDHHDRLAICAFMVGRGDDRSGISLPRTLWLFIGEWNDGITGHQIKTY